MSRADLPATREVRAAVFDQDKDASAIQSAVSPGTLAFGCAGLAGLFGSHRPWEKHAPTTYLCGELATLDQRPVFANLNFALLQRIS